jgi:hypothetical protein
MKTALVAIVFLWACLSVELAQVGRLPGHCLILPVACAVMFWSANGTGVMIAGCALVIDWIARPTDLPLVAVFVPTLAVVLMATETTRSGYRRRQIPSLPASWRLPLLTVVAAVLHLTSELIMVSFDDPLQSLAVFQSQLWALLLVAVPISVAAAIVLHVARELGFRSAFPNA